MTTQGTQSATYTNIATGETYTIGGIRDLEHAWAITEFVCNRMNWNHDMFTYDVRVRVA